MRWAALLMCALSLLAAGGAAHSGQAEQPVQYLLTPELGRDGLTALSVTVQLAGDADGVTAFELPNQWAGSTDLHSAIADLAVEGGTLTATDDPARREVSHAPGAELTLRYRVLPMDNADPAIEFEKARPVIRPGWFHAHGEGLFITRENGGDEPAAFIWGAMPAGWSHASDLDALDGRPLTANMIVNGVFVGGTDFRIVEREVGSAPVRIAMRCEWAFDDATFADTIARVIVAGNDWLAAEPVPYFVPLIPLTGGETGAVSFGGTGRTAGFALAATTNVSLDHFTRLIAHEYGHRWFGGSLGPLADAGATEYWFTEGFGDFAAAQALLAGGIWSEAEYVAQLNEVLLRYASSTARGKSNAVIAESFWSDPDAMQMHYDRGHLFALRLDGAARALGGVRAAVMRMAGAPEAFPREETQARRFVRAYEALTGGQITGDLATIIVAGEPIVLAADLFAPCGTIGWIEQPIYASGYTAEQDANGLYFVTVDETSPAWAAGLRPGMRYIRRESFKYGDAGVPIVMRVADAAGERVIQWLPQGGADVRFQRLVPNDFPDDASRAACRARLAGARPPS